MKKLSAVLYLFFVNISMASASVAIPASMKTAMKNESDMPGILNLVLSMAIVIGLIYLTGWIYQKLNKINKLKLSDSFSPDKNTFKVVSSLPLGQQKNLYAVEINGKVLVIGSTAQTLSLIKEFDNEENNESPNENISSKKSEETEKAEKADSLNLIYQKYKD